jgi:hypothetical protein
LNEDGPARSYSFSSPSVSLPYPSSDPPSSSSPHLPNVLPPWCSVSVLMTPSSSSCCARLSMRFVRFAAVSCCADSTLYNSSTCALPSWCCGAAAGDRPPPGIPPIPDAAGDAAATPTTLLLLLAADPKPQGLALNPEPRKAPAAPPALPALAGLPPNIPPGVAAA